MRALSILLLAGLLFTQAHGLYFRLHDSQAICFSEEIGYGSELISVEWSRRHLSVTRDVSVLATVISPVSRTTISNHKLHEASGSFTFRPIAGEVGEYDVCFAAPSLTVDGGRHVELSVAIDHRDRHHPLPKPDSEITRNKAPSGEEIFVFTDWDGNAKETLRTHEYLQRVTQYIGNIQNEITQVHGEVQYFHARQLRMRATSESTFDRVWGFSAITIGCVVVLSYLQYALLKQFLKRKKLI